MTFNENLPMRSNENIQQALLGPYERKRRYTKWQLLQQLAENIYKNLKRGTIFSDLQERNLAKHKEQAQSTLKHAARSGILLKEATNRWLIL